jgi:hypothetical protein
VLRREEFLEHLHIRNDYRYDVGFKAVAIHPHLRGHVGMREVRASNTQRKVEGRQAAMKTRRGSVRERNPGRKS